MLPWKLSLKTCVFSDYPDIFEKGLKLNVSLRPLEFRLGTSTARSCFGMMVVDEDVFCLAAWFVCGWQFL